MLANYGYFDASGYYFVTIDTEKCNGCGKCVDACPEALLEMHNDDYDDYVVKVKEEFVSRIGYSCPSDGPTCGLRCHKACEQNAIEHSF